MPNPKLVLAALLAAALTACADQGPTRLSHLGHATACSIAAAPNGSVLVAYVDGAEGGAKAAAFVRLAKNGTTFDSPQLLSDPANPYPVRDLQLFTSAQGTFWAIYFTAAAAGNGELFARNFDGAKWLPAFRVGKPLGKSLGNNAALDGVWSFSATIDPNGNMHVVWAEDPRPADQVTLTTCAPRTIRHADLLNVGPLHVNSLTDTLKDPPMNGYRCLDLAFDSAGTPQVLALNLDTQNVELLTPGKAQPLLATASYDLPPGRPSIGRRWLTAPNARPRFLTLPDGAGGGIHILAALEWTPAERANLRPANDMPEIIDMPLAPLLAGKNTATLVCETPNASILAGGFWLTRSANHPALLIATRSPDELLAFAPTPGNPTTWGDRYSLAKSKILAADALDGPNKSRRILTIIQQADQSWVELHQY